MTIPKVIYVLQERIDLITNAIFNFGGFKKGRYK